jgi:SOS regulatory protein LexA
VGKILGSIIKAARKRDDLSVKRLSELTGLSKSYLDYIENGQRTPSTETLKAICQILNLSENTIGHIHISEGFLISEITDVKNSENRQLEFQKKYDTLFDTVSNNPLKYYRDQLFLSDECLINSENLIKENGVEYGSSPFLKVPVLGIIRAGEPIRAVENIIGYEYLPSDMLVGGEFFGLRVTGDSMNNARIFEGDIVIVREQPEVENGELAIVLVDGENATIKRFYKADNIVTLMPDSTNKDHQPKFIDTTKVPVKVLGKVVKAVIDPSR